VMEHSEMQAQLAEWESALAQLTSGSFLESQRALQRLWRLVPFFEERMPQHFRREESEFFPALRARHPGEAAALARYSAEHAEFLRQWRTYRGELLYCDAVGETRGVYELGTRLVARLRQHMQDEELELMPLAEKV